MRRKRNLRKAQALVEFALIAAVLLLLFVVAIEGGMALSISHAYTEAAREAARHVSSARSPDAERTQTFAESFVRHQLEQKFGANSPIVHNASVAVYDAPAGATAHRSVVVEVTYPVPNSWFINRSGSMRIRGKCVFEAQDRYWETTSSS